MTGKRNERGFTYLTVLFVVAVLGVGLAATAVSWHRSSQREKEVELLFAGEEFRDAIALYYNRTPGQVKEYPKDLNDLLKDPRFPGPQRYLRRIYRDPILNSSSWGTVLDPAGRIMGVYSLSSDAPIKRSGFYEKEGGFDKASSYMDWRFVYLPVIASKL